MPDLTPYLDNALRASNTPPLVLPPAMASSLTLPAEMNFLERGISRQDMITRARTYFDKQLAQLPVEDRSRDGFLQEIHRLAANGHTENLAFLAQSVSSLGPLADTMLHVSAMPAEISKELNARLLTMLDLSFTYAQAMNDARNGTVLPHIQQEIEHAGQQFLQALTHPQSEPLNLASARLEGYESYTRCQRWSFHYGIGAGAGEFRETLGNLLIAARMGDQAKVIQHEREFVRQLNNILE